MRLLHPFMPFITEEIWQKLRESAADKENWPLALIKAPWPTDLIDRKRPQDPENELSFRVLEQAVGGIRELRSSLNIPPGKALKAVIGYREEMTQRALRLSEKEIARLARLESLEFKKDFKRGKSHVGHASQDIEVFIEIEGVVDLGKERQRIEKKVEECERYLDSIRKKLENPKFVENAPEELVEEERGKLLDAESLLKTHRDHLALFHSSDS